VAPEVGEVATRVFEKAATGVKRIAPTTIAIALNFFIASYSSFILPNMLRTRADSRLSSHFFRLRHRYPRRERSHIAYISICMHRM